MKKQLIYTHLFCPGALFILNLYREKIIKLAYEAVAKEKLLVHQKTVTIPTVNNVFPVSTGFCSHSKRVKS
jgi:hypothetical protein